MRLHPTRPWTWVRDARWPVAAHGIFWSGTFFFFVLYFGREADSYVQSLLFVALLLPAVMATTYFATNFLVPRFLLPGKYGLFALYGLYALIGSVYLQLVVLVLTFVLLAGYNIRWMSPPMLDLFGIVVGLYVVVFLAVAADLSMRWHRLRRAHDEAERARLEAELSLREAELARLKAQIQPHFLFNTLNNLYGLTLERSEHAPEVVLRISEMLDYVLYRCNGKRVPLTDEVQHLRTFLELEQLRYDERVEIRMEVVDPLPDGAIAPLILTPFVENAFKHGAARMAEAARVEVEVRAAERTLVFEVRNSKPAVPGAESKEGIGLENVRRRLRLLYPDAHRLEIDEGADEFAIRLTIPIHAAESRPAEEVSA